MKIHLPGLKENAIVHVQHEYDPAILELEFVDLKYLDKLRLDGTLEKGHDTLSFHGSLSSRVEHVCGRCLKTVEESVHQPFDLYYEIKGKEEIDSTDDIRESLLLFHTINYVCSEDCKGLCPECGVNRNLTACGCEAKGKKDSLASLKDIWNKSKEGKKNA